MWNARYYQVELLVHIKVKQNMEKSHYVRMYIRKNNYIKISYRMLPSTIWSKFFEFLIICWLISRAFGRVTQQQNTRNEENIGYIVRGNRWITSLSITHEKNIYIYNVYITYKIYTVFWFIIYQGKQNKHKRISFYF